MIRPKCFRTSEAERETDHDLKIQESVTMMSHAQDEPRWAGPPGVPDRMDYCCCPAVQPARPQIRETRCSQDKNETEQPADPGVPYLPKSACLRSEPGVQHQVLPSTGCMGSCMSSPFYPPNRTGSKFQSQRGKLRPGGGSLAGKMALGVHLKEALKTFTQIWLLLVPGTLLPRILGMGIRALPRLGTEVPGHQPAVSRVSQWP